MDSRVGLPKDAQRDRTDEVRGDRFAIYILPDGTQTDSLSDVQRAVLRDKQVGERRRQHRNLVMKVLCDYAYVLGMVEVMLEESGSNELPSYISHDKITEAIMAVDELTRE